LSALDHDLTRLVASLSSPTCQWVSKGSSFRIAVGWSPPAARRS